MKKTYIVPLISFLALIQFLLVDCKKDSTISITDTQKPKEASVPDKFIWNGLHDYYLWTDQVPNLSSTRFANADTLNKFLNQYTDPEKLFYDLLYQYKVIDKWSFIANDSKTITDWISGNSKTTGIDFMLGGILNSPNLFGFVRYVMKDSPAEKAGIKRGDIFIKVDDQNITASNYQSLLFSKDQYKFSFADIVNHTITPNNRSLTVTAVQMQENPILKDTVIAVNGSNVGYLVYNQFNSDFDIQLNNVFQNFKNQGVSKLILDLRYNGGGAVTSAIYLASMIYSTDKTKVFAKSSYNKGLQDYFVQTYGASSLLDYFTDKIDKTTSTPETPINSLGINTLYVITSDNTASASELLINGLKPYMQLKEIGIETAGKYVGSSTLQDMDSKGVVNTQDPWTMQPIVVKIANSQGVTDFVNGLAPDIRAEEDPGLLLPLGDPTETLLQAVLNDIKGLPQKGLMLKSISVNKIFDSGDLKPFSKRMYIKPSLIQKFMPKE
jgi:carboxyl-terminal processing protease